MSLPNICHCFRFRNAPWSLILQFGNAKHVRINKVVIELSHENEIVSEAEINPKMWIAKASCDLFKGHKSNVLMQQVIHRVRILTENIRSPVCKPKEWDGPEHETKKTLIDALDVICCGTIQVSQRVQKLSNPRSSLVNVNRIGIKAGMNGGFDSRLRRETRVIVSSVSNCDFQRNWILAW